MSPYAYSYTPFTPHARNSMCAASTSGVGECKHRDPGDGPHQGLLKGQAYGALLNREDGMIDAEIKTIH